jgi:hypothetical protein
MRVSRQIGWSDKSNVLYDILQELEAISCKIACSDTTTTTTTTPPPCNTYVLLQTPVYDSYTGVGCDGNSISGTISQPGITLCAQSITFDGPLYNLDSSCNPECMLYSIVPFDDINDYQYTDCDNNVITGSFSTLEGIYACVKPGTTSGLNVTFTQIGPCKCIEYQINGGFVSGGTYSYIGCDFSINNNVTIGAEESVIICALAIPTLSDYVNMGVDVIGICNP